MYAPVHYTPFHQGQSVNKGFVLYLDSKHFSKVGSLFLKVKGCLCLLVVLFQKFGDCSFLKNEVVGCLHRRMKRVPSQLSTIGIFSWI